MDDSAPDNEWLVNQIAHALRNPIFAALVQAEAVSMRTSQLPDAARAARNLHGQLKRLEAQVDDMLLYGRPTPCCVTTVAVDDLVRTIAAAYRRGDRQEPAEVIVDNQIGKVEALWDLKLVEIILQRLLDNAVQHTSAPHRVWITVTEDGADHLCLAVRDQGEGIPVDLRDRVFQPFFPQHRGRPGLGLAIARKLAQRLGGTITITSEEGAGTEARCSVPRRLSDE